MTNCPYCKNTGKMYEINYMSWYDPNNSPKSLDEIICERDCSYCMGKSKIENQITIKFEKGPMEHGDEKANQIEK